MFGNLILCQLILLYYIGGYFNVYLLNIFDVLILSLHLQVKARTGSLLQQLHGSLRLFTWNRTPLYRKKMLLFVACFFILFFQIIGMGSVIVFFLLHHPLDFLPEEIGYYFALINATKFIGLCFHLIRSFQIYK